MNIDVTDNPEEHRYQARADGTPAGFVEYQIRDGQIALIHTEVDDAFEGKGVGSSLVKGALGRVRESGLGLLPVCPFVAGYIKRHPEYLDLVPEQQRARFDLPEAGSSM